MAPKDDKMDPLIVQLAGDLLYSQTAVIVDTETTGLKRCDEVVQLAILGVDGSEVLDTKLKPAVASMSPGAAKIHGITGEQLVTAPLLKELRKDVKHILDRAECIVAYNAPFDKRMLAQSAAANDDQELADIIQRKKWVDIMIPYAAYWGEYTYGHYTPKWQTLTNACKQQSVEIDNAHNAMGDAKMTLALLDKIYSLSARRDYILAALYEDPGD